MFLKVTPFNILGTGCGTYKKESGTITTEKLYIGTSLSSTEIYAKLFAAFCFISLIRFCRYIRLVSICVS